MYSERGMNPVAVTIINPRKEYWPSCGSNQQPATSCSQILLIELWGLGKKKKKKKIYGIKILHVLQSQLCQAPGAHLVAYRTGEQEVVGSIPSSGNILLDD